MRLKAPHFHPHHLCINSYCTWSLPSTQETKQRRQSCTPLSMSSLWHIERNLNNHTFHLRVAAPETKLWLYNWSASFRKAHKSTTSDWTSNRQNVPSWEDFKQSYVSRFLFSFPSHNCSWKRASFDCNEVSWFSSAGWCHVQICMLPNKGSEPHIKEMINDGFRPIHHFSSTNSSL